MPPIIAKNIRTSNKERNKEGIVKKQLNLKK